jgi:hypothetical protein
MGDVRYLHIRSYKTFELGKHKRFPPDFLCKKTLHMNEDRRSYIGPDNTNGGLTIAYREVDVDTWDIGMVFCPKGVPYSKRSGRNIARSRLEKNHLRIKVQEGDELTPKSLYLAVYALLVDFPAKHEWTTIKEPWRGDRFHTRSWTSFYGPDGRVLIALTDGHPPGRAAGLLTPEECRAQNLPENWYAYAQGWLFKNIPPWAGHFLRSL